MKTRQKAYNSPPPPPPPAPPTLVAKAAKKKARRTKQKSQELPEEAETELPLSAVIIPHDDDAPGGRSGIVESGLGARGEEIAAAAVQEFVVSLHEKVEDCVCSPEVDVHSFAKRLVTEARSALRVLAKREIQSEQKQHKEVEQQQQQKQQPAGTVFGSEIPENGQSFSEFVVAGGDRGERFFAAEAEEKVGKKLARMLLVKPKSLARQFKDCRSPSSVLATTTMTSNTIAFQGGDLVRTVQEKVRAYELQIMLRMELIGCDTDEKKKSLLVEDICELLDSIQFDINCVVSGGESLQEYSVRVIHSRYKDHLPHTVNAIFHTMEFNGYSTPIPTAKARSRSEDVGSKLDGKVKHSEKRSEKLHSMQGTKMALETQEQTTSSKGDSAKDRKLKVPVAENTLEAIRLTQASEKKMQALKRKHYGGPVRHLKLKQVRLKNQAPKNMPKLSNTAPVKCEATKCNVVNETPMVRCRQQAFAETSRDHPVPDDPDVVGLLPARAVTHGFQTPADPPRPSTETASRKRGLFPSGYVPCTIRKEKRAKRELLRQQKKLGAALQHSAFRSLSKVPSQLCQ